MFRTLLLLTMLGTTAIIIAGFGGRLHPAFDTLSNFRLHLCIGLVLLTILWSFRCSRAPALVFALIGFFGVASTSPGLPLQSGTYRSAEDEKLYTAFVMNMLWNNTKKPEVIRRINELDPDVLLLTEHSHQWLRPVQQLAKRYPYSLNCAEWGEFWGSMILSKFPPAVPDRKDFCGYYFSLAVADFVVDGKSVSFGITHLRWPWPASGPRIIGSLEPALRALPDNALIAGDFNSVTWSHSVRRFADMGGLSTFQGIGPTWAPGFFIDGGFWQVPQAIGFPIDNAMTKGKVKIVSARRLENLGSDHLPILIEFVVTK